jgi:IS30 family transposase
LHVSLLGKFYTFRARTEFAVLASLAGQLPERPLHGNRTELENCNVRFGDHPPGTRLLDRNRKLRLIVTSKLILDWSPEQISGWLKRRYPSDESMGVSHETIYRSLFIQARGVLKKELMQHLRSKRQIRRSVHAKAAGQSRSQIVDAISISERPAETEDRAVPGHWEGDLLSGSGNSHIATLVERHSRFNL